MNQYFDLYQQVGRSTVWAQDRSSTLSLVISSLSPFHHHHHFHHIH